MSGSFRITCGGTIYRMNLNPWKHAPNLSRAQLRDIAEALNDHSSLLEPFIEAPENLIKDAESLVGGFMPLVGALIGGVIGGCVGFMGNVMGAPSSEEIQEARRRKKEAQRNYKLLRKRVRGARGTQVS